MKLIRNEKGIALVMVLIFSLIGLAIVSAMLFMLTQGTRISGSLKIYKSGDEAGLGGTLTLAEMIKNKGLAPALTTQPFGLDACLQQKLSTSRGAGTTLATTLWTICKADPTRLSLDPTVSPDMTVDFPGPPGITFRAYTKIVDTVKGNTDTSGIVTSGQLGGTGVVEAAGGQSFAAANPYLYKLEIQTQNLTNPTEKSRYSALYAH
ncbi:MAG: hypothetical protein ACHQ0Y_03570 [Thermodesulfovibrionales bacterium]